MSQPIHFVHETKPGTALDSSQVRALRSHVRKVNLERSNQKSTRRLENFRSLTVDDFSETGKIKGGRRKQSLQPGATHSLETEIENLPLGEDPAPALPLVPSSPETSTRAFHFLSPPGTNGRLRQCSCRRTNLSRPQTQSPRHSSSPGTSPLRASKHPYASRVSAAVDLDEGRIDYLLKSCAFQVAAEPLLSPAAVNGRFAALSVFPECLSNSAFLYALLYSILFIDNAGEATNESLFLKSKAIELLRVELHQDDPNIRVLSIGTILLFSCVAYHCGELAESTAHSEGLYKLLSFSHADGTRLRADVLRAIFWQQLLSTSLVCNRHQFQTPDFQGLLNNPQDLSIGAPPQLPFGFELHEGVISNEVLLCIRTVLKLQNLVASIFTDPTTIEDLQVCIEARLVFQEDSCKELGPIAESTRIAVYIVNYMCKSAMWKSAFVPLRLAEKLLHYLSKTGSTDIWRYRRDLFVWLLFIGASAGRGQNCFGADLATRYQDLIRRTTEDVSNWADLKNGPKALHNVMKSFIYAKDWIAQRHLLPGWNTLERAVFMCGMDDVNIDVDTDAALQEMVPETNLFE